MENVIAIVTEYWPVVVGFAAALVAAYLKFIAPKTKTTRDDEILAQVKDALDKLDGNNDEPTA